MAATPRVGFQKCKWGDFAGGAVDKNLPPMQGTQIQSLVLEYPTCLGATKSMFHNY